MAQAFSIEKVGRAKGINGQVTFWSWGADSHGQLSQGHCEGQLLPRHVKTQIGQDVVHREGHRPYVDGANSYGQLSQGHCEDQLVPRQVKIQIRQDVEKVTGGGGHTFVITKDGQLQACGSNNKGQLGLGHLTDVSELTTITHFSSTRITQVAAGWDFSLAVTEEGHVFTFGSNAFGQLGNPSLPQKCSTQTRTEIPDNRPVVKVAAGLRHSVALTEDGSVYCWGHAKKGQCGYTSEETPSLKIATPTKVPLPEVKGRIIYIVAGSYHTAALSDSGEVLVWGCNKYGQTAQNPESCLQVNSPYVIPVEMFQDHNVKAIRSGWTHLIAQTETGDLYSWGRADYCQLGRSVPKETLFTPIPGLIDTPEKIVDLQCGSEYALFLSDKQKCYAVGWNEHGLCGTGDEQNVSQLRLVEVLKDYSVIKIGCGGGHCFAITESNPLPNDKILGCSKFK